MKHRILKTALESHPLILLRAIAMRHDLEAEDASKETLLHDTHDLLSNPERVAQLLAEMDEECRAALDLLIAFGGQMASHRLQRDPLGGELRILGTGAMQRARPWESPISETERLFYLGFIYQDFGIIGDFRGQVLFIPDELLALFPAVESSPIKFEVKPLAGIPPGTRLSSLALVEDAFVVLSDLQRRHVYPLKGRYLPPDALQRINERLKVPESPLALKKERDTQRLALLMHLLRILVLVEETPEGLLKPVAARARKWLQVPRARRLLSLQRAYADDPAWNDLWRIPSLRPQPTGWRNDPHRARTALIGWLRQVPPAEWISIGDFIKAIKRIDPDFQRPDGDYNSWHIRHLESGQMVRGWQNWEQVEGTLLRYYFTAPLFWLGIVDLGYLAPNDKQPFAFRLTPYGTHWLGHEVELPAPPERAPMIICSDGTVTVPRGADDWERMHLERLSLPVEEGQGDYKLDKNKIMTLLMEGSDMQRVVRFLEHATNNVLPDEVRKQLHQWAGGYGRITLEQCIVFEVDDARLLRDLQRQANISVYFERPLGPRIVAVAPQNLQPLITTLRTSGYLPRVIGGEGGERDDS